MPESAQYPLPKFHFQVDWGGSNLGFTEAKGLNKKGLSKKTRFNKTKQPGLTKFTNVTLKRGVFKSSKSSRLIKFTKSDLVIRLLNEKGIVVAAWKLKNAWPLKIKATDLKAGSNEVVIETIEIAHEGLSLLDR